MKKQDGLRAVLRPTRETSQRYSGLPVMVLLLFATALTVCDLFPSVPLAWWELLAVLLGGYALLWLLELTGKGRLVCWGAMVAVLLVCTLSYGQVLAGLGALGNDLATLLTRFTGRIHLAFSAGSSGSILWGLLPLLALWLALLQLSLLTERLLFSLPVLLTLWGAVLVGLVPVTAGTLLLGLGTILLMMRRAGGFPAWLPVALVSAAVAAGVGLFVPSGTGSLPAWKTLAHELLYHGETSMPEGNLKNLSAWEPGDTPALKITMSQPEKLYLRGTVYETYGPSGWTALSADARVEAADLFYWLHQSEFYGQSQIGAASALVSRETPQHLTVQTLSACSGHGYLPYALVGSDGLDSTLIGDAVFPTVTEMTLLPGSLPEWYAAQQALASDQTRGNVADYLAAEKAYESYVTRQDLQLTNESWSVLNRQFGGDAAPKTLSEIRTVIRQTLDKTLIYDESVQTLNGNGDFLQYTLEKSGSGYSVHYATAAVLMLRYFGVPARYVEGYFLPGAEAAACEAGESILLTEAHAHAWAEYYLPGVGFVPFEVTPGYMDDEELELGGSLTQEEQTYTGEHMKYAQVEQPEQVKDPEQGRTAFSAEPEWLLWLLGVAAAALTAVILHKRVKLKRALKAMAAAPNREAIAMTFGYAAALLDTCPSLQMEGAGGAAELNREALFSTHEMTAQQRQQMKDFAAAVLKDCRAAWTLGQKLRYRFWDCLY